MKLIVLLLLVWVSPAVAAEYGKVSMEKVADGVYLFRTTPYGVGLSGNSVAIVGKNGVMIFDSNGLPATAETILKEIKKLTDQPVQYLINSHWHWDHWAGNQVYRAAFPAMQIIAHTNTRKQMLEVEPRWNDQGLKEGLPGYIKQLEADLEKGRAAGKSREEIQQQEEFLIAATNFLQQKVSLVKTIPEVTFDGSMTVYLKEKTIEVRHARAITIGDSYVFLPQDKILITGDILLSPYPYAIGGSYPTDWLKNLEELVKLQPSIIIPGHGAQQKPEFLQQNVEMFRTILQHVKNSHSAKSGVDAAKTEIGSQAKKLGAMIGVSDPQVVEEFKSYFLDVFVARAYRELDGPLGDLPEGLPK